ncbi:exonuclease SbcCD subunit D C-terminal domain-containing protein, partial [Deltaproteobacteria bacterium OttesenSCG-928-M10]|nr:exonuclease SbcCD subunit D C-terminal domain-containing protein [Deltaproteobacteria bacterium OttesenSCG-928-M10]
DVFSPVFDYVALGHLHQPQVVGGDPTRRYSGAPLAMTFAEAGSPKSVTLVDLAENGPEIFTIEVPVFQRLERLSGDRAGLESAIEALKSENADIWLELEYTGLEVWGDLRESLTDMVKGSPLEILRIRDRRDRSASLAGRQEAETLESLDAKEVFRRLLADRQVPPEQWPELEAAYGIIVSRLFEDGGNGEGGRRADT